MPPGVQALEAEPLELVYERVELMAQPYNLDREDGYIKAGIDYLTEMAAGKTRDEVSQNSAAQISPRTVSRTRRKMQEALGLSQLPTAALVYKMLLWGDLPYTLRPQEACTLTDVRQTQCYLTALGFSDRELGSLTGYAERAHRKRRTLATNALGVRATSSAVRQAFVFGIFKPLKGPNAELST